MAASNRAPTNTGSGYHFVGVFFQAFVMRPAQVSIVQLMAMGRFSVIEAAYIDTIKSMDPGVFLILDEIRKRPEHPKSSKYNLLNGILENVRES